MEPHAVASPSTDRLQRTAFWALCAAVSVVVISIAASQVFLAAALMLAVCSKRCRRALRPRRTLFLVCLLFIGWTMIAVLKSHDVARALLEAKKFFLYSILFLTPALVTDNADLLKTYRSIFAFSALGACAGLVQFALSPSFNLDLPRRISGFMSHWMTYSGLLMLVLVVLAAYAVCNRKVQWWVIALAVMLGAGMYLSETRNAWLGSIAGLTVVFALRRPLRVLSLAALVVSLYFLSPQPIQQRLRSGWDQNDPETRGRLELAGTAIRLIRDNPWTGVGPKNVNRESLRYRGTKEFPDWLYQHMHNNPLQIAGERGIPGLIFWLWLMAQMGWDALIVFRTSGENTEASMSATAALGCLVALLVAGMFEYNFGDSEVVTLFLFVMASPYAFLRSGVSVECETDGRILRPSLDAQPN